MTIALWARFDASGWYERLIDFAGDDSGSNRDNIIIGRKEDTDIIMFMIKNDDNNVTEFCNGEYNT